MTGNEDGNHDQGRNCTKSGLKDEETGDAANVPLFLLGAFRRRETWGFRFDRKIHEEKVERSHYK